MRRYGHVLVAGLLAGLAALAQAAGGGGGGPASGSRPDAATAVQERQLQAALTAQDWPVALALLADLRRQQPENADWWNWTGYAERKRGNLDAAFPAYYEALRLNPAHLGAHEYLGEAYLQAGQRELAEEQLNELGRLCGECREQQELAAALRHDTPRPPEAAQ
ncbi:tetratricopeptide repeat protein [Chitinilyticum litopenaei]|uniref:tetratricopeptide repeat protein n=1 Tax=Chitinilyticum litopenaei TaxID=1121276 RepID=UPI0004067C4B|nr:tetratricopeptide repeat protein [Chitinilyticum litopenaei]